MKNDFVKVIQFYQLNNYQFIVTKYIIILYIIFFFTGCTRTPLSIETLTNSSFTPIVFFSSPPLKALYHHTENSENTLWVMIEGDGHAWSNIHTPSLNPTPINPIGLKIASSIDANNVLYLSRPCQFLTEIELKECNTSDWTDGRFAQKWVNTMNEAINQIKTQYGYESIILAGYSGGGTMATLIATQRQDIKLLITIASPLNLYAWSNYHHISILKKSLDPKNAVIKLSSIPQIHIVGENDRVVPPLLTRTFIKYYPSQKNVLIKEVDANHSMNLSLDLVKFKKLFLDSID